MPSISFAISAHNEHEELDRLLKVLIDYVDQDDEIVVQLDTTATKQVKEVLQNYTNKVKVIEFSLNGNFANFKNNLKNACTKDYIFNIDADEVPSESLLSSLKEVLFSNFHIDVFLVPRINTVDGLTDEHIHRWGWKVEDNRINFPDYQWRIWKNRSDIVWINEVHEVLSGYRIFSALPSLDEFCLLHHKSISRQEKQNELYDKIQRG
jgi:glycosyltransferase involved in cell wall biosynthesis